jgi:hypothetical protein
MKGRLRLRNLYCLFFIMIVYHIFILSGCGIPVPREAKQPITQAHLDGNNQTQTTLHAGASSSNHSTQKTGSPPPSTASIAQAHTDFLKLENTLQHDRALRRLQDSLKAFADGSHSGNANHHAFEDVEPSLLYHIFRIRPERPGMDTTKYIIGGNAIKHLGKEYVAYGAGIANDPSFEEFLGSRLNASVFGLDCTIDGRTHFTSFQFHNWCIGKDKDLRRSMYAKDSASELIFLPLREIKKKLGHTRVDLLKMDIEGCEWDILYDEILSGRDEDLPTQLLFELHTQGANPAFVPAHLVQGKRRKQVTQLIYDLYQRNYRVFHLEVNPYDYHCAEIGLYRVSTAQNVSLGMT